MKKIILSILFLPFFLPSVVHAGSNSQLLELELRVLLPCSQKLNAELKKLPDLEFFQNCVFKIVSDLNYRPLRRSLLKTLPQRATDIDPISLESLFYALLNNVESSPKILLKVKYLQEMFMKRDEILRSLAKVLLKITIIKFETLLLDNNITSHQKEAKEVANFNHSLWNKLKGEDEIADNSIHEFLDERYMDAVSETSYFKSAFDRPSLKRMLRLDQKLLKLVL